MTLQTVTFGTNHWSPAAFWKRLLLRLPDKVRVRLGKALPTQYTTSTPQLAFWLTRKNKTDKRPLSYRLADESRFESLTILSDISPSFTALNSNLEQAVFGTEVFPRRSSTFRLRVYQGDNMLVHREEFINRLAHVADFAVQNPVRKSYPSWTAQRKPIARRDGEMEFTLTKLALTINPREGPEALYVFPNTWAEACFRITQAGHLCKDWKVESIELFEATGQAWRFFEARGESAAVQSRLISETIGEEEASTFAWPFWLQETAWKLRVEFTRKPEAHFADGELWTVKGIAVPTPRAVTMINQSTNLLGRPVRLLALVGEHAVLPGREHDVFGQTTIEVDVPPLPSELHFKILSVTDDRGRVAEQVMRSGNESFGCPIPPDARTVDIKLALYQRRCAEYVVRPTVQTADVANFRR
ncbi:MAG: hypothetical protein HY674_02685 [Chloroflexi bacterium]|nr:hypothetical protein [Chloroflexota bacterium]